MKTIELGKTAVTDKSGTSFLCTLSIPRCSSMPDVRVHFADELALNETNLLSDSKVLSDINSFLRSLGYNGSPLSISHSSGRELVLEVSGDFFSFAESKGWVDLLKNPVEAKKLAIIAVVDPESSSENVRQHPSDERFSFAGEKYLVFELYSLLPELVKKVVSNLSLIETGYLAEHTTTHLAESAEKRRELIKTQRDFYGNNHQFCDWINDFILSHHDLTVSLFKYKSLSEILATFMQAAVVGKSFDQIVLRCLD